MFAQVIAAITGWATGLGGVSGEGFGGAGSFAGGGGEGD